MEQHKGQSGVYLITNNTNGKIYIGSAYDLYKRYWSHFNNLKLNQHPNRHLQSAYNKYGLENFSMKALEIIERIDDKSDFKIILEAREQHYLDNLLHAQEDNDLFHEKGYNNRRIAKSNLGIKFSAEIRLNMGREKGFIQPPHIAHRLRTQKIGKKDSVETKIKKSESLKKYRASDEYRQWLKENPFHHTEEHKKKLSHKYGKAVLQFDLQGNLLNEFYCTREAKEKTKNGSVTASCLGKYRKAGKHLFLYKEDYEKMTKDQFKERLTLATNPRPLPANARKVNQLDKDTNEIINTFDSCMSAGIYIGKRDGGNISSACSGKLTTCYGYKWQYA
jgi:group I intron endonuclease